MEKFYEGSEWHRFCCGGGDSPDGPVIIAHIVKMVADYYDELLAAAEQAAASAKPASARPQGDARARAGTSTSSRPSKRRRG
eukprot:2063221-Pleurochrysis_carterae.AAC.1